MYTYSHATTIVNFVSAEMSELVRKPLKQTSDETTMSSTTTTSSSSGMLEKLKR